MTKGSDFKPVAEALATPPIRVEEVTRRVTRRRRRRHTGLGVAVILAALGVGLAWWPRSPSEVVATTTPSDAAATPRSPASTPPAPDTTSAVPDRQDSVPEEGDVTEIEKRVVIGWQLAEGVPLTSREGAAIAVGPSSVLVWGGTSTDNSVLLDDGAVYDFADASWTTTAEAPLEGTAFPTMIHAEPGFYVASSTSTEGTAAAIAHYDPSTNTWSPNLTQLGPIRPGAVLNEIDGDYVQVGGFEWIGGDPSRDIVIVDGDSGEITTAVAPVPATAFPRLRPGSGANGATGTDHGFGVAHLVGFAETRALELLLYDHPARTWQTIAGPSVADNEFLESELQVVFDRAGSEIRVIVEGDQLYALIYSFATESWRRVDVRSEVCAFVQVVAFEGNTAIAACDAVYWWPAGPDSQPAEVAANPDPFTSTGLLALQSGPGWLDLGSGTLLIATS